MVAIGNVHPARPVLVEPHPSSTVAKGLYDGLSSVMQPPTFPSTGAVPHAVEPSGLLR